ncbi:MAG: 50S ribosomal protein L19 [Candidatus Shikimatogenerans bostrichidophilus]|nr:MAG: 50S ribosomal protein L19 [Candidatus Shikimatogenerans bostrichidophilus]
MNKIIKYLEKKYLKNKYKYDIKVGDNISVYYSNIEIGKNKSQVFTGYVISKKGNNKFNKTFIVRKIINNIGVEMIFFLYSPFIKNIIINSRGKVKRSKIFYLRYNNKKIKNRDYK